ncbi:LOW QUALITY PROTEIN: adenylate kinase, chloroplastic-like [Aristolochia californica]|uniref:LOW QUALITY PROTEIN: adenylate kinase, chloroplastic-like n=1 Tax=Aristolochia californica TaxID=171875 RepID=UPI0035E2FB15
MASLSNFPVVAKSTPQSSSSSSRPLSSSNKHLISFSSSFHLPLSSSTSITGSSLCLYESLIRKHLKLSHDGTHAKLSIFTPFVPVMAASKPEPLKVMISGAPASGKGTQCGFISKKYGLTHIAAGDLLRAEIAAGTENGKRAKEYMERGQLVPDKIVVTMVKERLFQSDAQENGWLLDGYPRSLSQAQALEDLGIEPDIFIVLDVSEDSLVERVVGRRLDPVTGKIYHLKYLPPETEEIAARLTQRFDDTEEKVKLRLQTFHQNVEVVLSKYKDNMVKIDGNASKEDVFSEIDAALTRVFEKREANSSSMATVSIKS